MCPIAQKSKAFDRENYEVTMKGLGDLGASEMAGGTKVLNRFLSPHFYIPSIPPGLPAWQQRSGTQG